MLVTTREVSHSLLRFGRLHIWTLQHLRTWRVAGRHGRSKMRTRKFDAAALTSMQRAALQKARDGSQLRQACVMARVRAFHSAVWSLDLWRSGSAVDFKPIWAQQRRHTALHVGGRNGARAQRDSAIVSVGVATRQWGRSGPRAWAQFGVVVLCV